jgi:transposase-like protein
LEELIDKLIRLHPEEKEVFSTIVIDQINSVASAFRNWNSEVDRLKRENKSIENAS